MASSDDESHQPSDAEVDDYSDTVCAICDNGGELLICDGRCKRAFHATANAGAVFNCVSLGISRAQLRAMKSFVCNNCQYNLHPCFSCGQLGSSDVAWGAEVFPCVSATCRFFYHPECVAKLLHPENKVEAEECKRKISAGESFTCPVHKCLVCKEKENLNFEELQFAVCRCCPKSYHRKCLPREIVIDDWRLASDEGLRTRGWLVLDRVLMYCLDHEIDETLGRPKENHFVLF